MLAAILLLASTAAEDRATAATRTWATCLRVGYEKLKESSEAADVVTDAVLGTCTDEQSAFVGAWMPVYAGLSLRTAEADTAEAMNRMKQKFREMILSELVAYRISRK